jgi:site-specific recombinase XerD
MASLYRQKTSKYWWIKYRSVTGKIVRESTKFRTDIPLDTRKARAEEARMTLQELEHTRGSAKERWEAWVPDYLNLRYQGKPRTIERYMCDWKNLNIYLRERKILYPSQLTYPDCMDYLKLRKAGWKQGGLHQAEHNTALHELKLLGLVMKEAVRRGFASGNPAVSLGVGKQAAKEKLAVPDEDLVFIRQKLEEQPEWMRIAWDIALYTGCRLRETCLRMADVHLDERTIYLRAKGGKLFTIPVRDELVPLLTRLKAEGREYAYEMPRLPSKDFWAFLKGINMSRYSFHCLRVTFISRGAQSGVPESYMRRLVGHASTSIHRIYQRLRVEEDLRPALEKIHLPTPAPSAPQKSGGTPPASSSTPEPRQPMSDPDTAEDHLSPLAW